jgi:hypothetical protein
MKPSSCVPRRWPSEVRFLRIQPHLGGKDLRAAGRAVEYYVGQTPHLRMATLAGVSTQGIGQGGYPLEGPEDRTLGGETAGVASGQLRSPTRPQLARTARWADDVAWLGGFVRWCFHRGLPLRWSPTLCWGVFLRLRSETSRPLRRRCALCWRWRTRSRVTPSSLLSSARVAGSRSSRP